MLNAETARDGVFETRTFVLWPHRALGLKGAAALLADCIALRAGDLATLHTFAKRCQTLRGSLFVHVDDKLKQRRGASPRFCRRTAVCDCKSRKENHAIKREH